MPFPALFRGEKLFQDALAHSPEEVAVWRRLSACRRDLAQSLFRADKAALRDIRDALGVRHLPTLRHATLNGAGLARVLSLLSGPRLAAAREVLRLRGAAFGAHQPLALAEWRGFMRRARVPPGDADEARQVALGGLLVAVDKYRGGAWVPCARQRVRAALIRWRSRTDVTLSHDEATALYCVRGMLSQNPRLGVEAVLGLAQLRLWDRGIPRPTADLRRLVLLAQPAGVEDLARCAAIEPDEEGDDGREEALRAALARLSPEERALAAQCAPEQVRQLRRAMGVRRQSTP